MELPTDPLEDDVAGEQLREVVNIVEVTRAALVR
jgi:hypothetical protein